MSAKKGKATKPAPKEETKTTAPPSQDLPLKQANLFRQVVKAYEAKQYKKGMKAAEQILKKFPHHGETTAMKGLLLNCLGNKEEAQELIRLGLRYNLKSHVCWHVYGLFHRADRNYVEASKCYLNALKIDKDNVQILRDLSSLQIQIRDIEGFRETRRQILVLKPGNRNNWMTFAIADYLSGEYSKAVNVIESYEKTIENPTANYDQSEMLLFKNSILRASRDLEAALVHLNNSEKFILDTLSFLEAKGTILLQLGKNAEACKVYEQLLDLNSENVSYHIGYAKAHGVEIIQNFLDPLSSQDVDTLSTLYAQLSTKFTKSFLVSRIPLDFLQGLPFEGALSEFLKKNLPKGIPSLFRNLRWLYVFDSKKRSFEIIINRFLANLESCLKFSISDDSKQYPSSLLWTYKFAAEHYDHCGQYEKALELVNKGIDHTPTAIDLYVTKSKILKHAGEIKAAFRVTDYARRLDLADRYLNSRAVKYAFKAGDVETAKSIVVLFLKERDTEQLHALFEMQCNWYEIAFGESLKQSGTFGKALKNFFAVHKHFDDYFEDQFDFHQYCIRKMTLNAYVESLKFGDAVKNHKFYFRATKNIVEIYLHLARQKLSKTSSEIDERKLSEADKKKLAIKTKQAKAKAAKEDVTKKAASKRDVSKRSEAARKYEEEDPDGLKLLNVSDYLSEAAKWVKDLELHCASFLDSHALAVKIHVSRKKFLLAFRALQRCIAKSPKSPITLNAMSHFIASWNKEVDHVDPIVSKIIQKNLDSIELIKNSQGILKLLRESCVSIYDAALYYEAVLRLNALAVRDALAFLFSFDLKNSSHKQCALSMEYLKSLGLEATHLDTLKLNFKKRFVLSTEFGNPGYADALPE